jgi:hypothetical protein
MMVSSAPALSIQGPEGMDAKHRMYACVFNRVYAPELTQSQSHGGTVNTLMYALFVYDILPTMNYTHARRFAMTYKIIHLFSARKINQP